MSVHVKRLSVKAEIDVLDVNLSAWLVPQVSASGSSVPGHFFVSKAKTLHLYTFVISHFLTGIVARGGCVGIYVLSARAAKACRPLKLIFSKLIDLVTLKL